MGKKARDELPISDSHEEDQETDSTRRFRSFSERMIRSLTSSSTVPFRRSMSEPLDPGRRRRWSLRLWWEKCRAWVSSLIPATKRREKDTILLGGGQNQGSSWKRFAYKLQSKLRGNGGGAGKGFQYDSFSYAQNFDDGIHDAEDWDEVATAS